MLLSLGAPGLSRQAHRGMLVVRPTDHRLGSSHRGVTGEVSRVHSQQCSGCCAPQMV